MNYRICKVCNKRFKTYPCRIKIREGKYCSTKCYWKSKKGMWTGSKNPKYEKGYLLERENNPRWKGGLYKDSDGYIYKMNHSHPFKNNMGYVYEHRLIMEKQIGRYLHRWEVCHHINKITDDNRIKNLMLFKNHSTHRKFEGGVRVKPSEIIFDGRKIKEKNKCLII